MIGKWKAELPDFGDGSGTEGRLGQQEKVRAQNRRRASLLYSVGKGMPKISAKNQLTIPVAALEEVGLHAGERVTVEPAGDGELRIRRSTTTFEDAFGMLTG